MTYSANLIAYAFVKKGIEQNRPITQMKLQKLVFFAQGVHLAQNGESLVNEDFEAWQFGPVIPSIYQQYKSFGNNFIKSSPCNYDAQLSSIDDTAKSSIEYTWTVTKNLSAMTLSNWTHIKGSPWETAYIPGYSHIQIDNSSIEKFFKTFLEAASNAKADFTQPK